MVDEGFANEPPEWGEETRYISTDPNNAWKQKLIEIHHYVDKTNIPQALKDQIKLCVDQILTNAGMTNITKGQILEFLQDWDNKMHVLKVMNPEIDGPEFQDFKRSIRLELKLQLNKSKEGWQGDHAFETHIKQDLKQRHETTVQKVGRFFGRRKRKVIEESEG